MAAFNGQLRSNEIFSALYNMIISQQVFADNIQKHQTLVDKAKEEAGLFGDQKLYYSADVLGSNPWGVDASHPKGGVMDVEAGNLLSLDRPEPPEVQALVIDTFRQVRLTTDEYMSKRAWGTESAFANFTSVMIGMIDIAKKIYEGTLYNVFIGTTVSADAKQNISIDLDAGVDADVDESALDLAKLEAMNIAQGLANLFVKMGDYSRDFNDYHHMRSYAGENIKVVWNAKYINKIRKVDLPTIFHKDGLVDKFDEDVLPERYFGRAVTEADIGANKIIGADGAYDSTKGTLHAARELVYNDVHYFPGEELATSGTYVAVVGGLDAKDVYIEDADVICKVLVKLPPLLSAFSVGTSFFNPRSLTTNRYLTWGHSTLEYLKNYPFITVKAA